MKVLPPPPSSSSQHGHRRSSGPISSPRDRFTPPLRCRSPSPSTSRRFTYDSYKPPRAEPAYREDYPNVYRPNVYRPDHSIYYSRSPSPDSYPISRPSDHDIWDRPSSWQSTNSSAWHDRIALPPSPTLSAPRDRGRRDTMMATRMFEPSDAWKQTQVERPLRIDTSRTMLGDRSGSHYSRRASMEVSPDRPLRVDRSPAYPSSGDCYRPGQSYREPLVTGRSGGDSYRPQYRDGRAPPARDLAADLRRRSSASTPQTRSVSHFGYHRRLSNAISNSSSRSPRLRHAARSRWSRSRSRSPIRRSRSREPQYTPHVDHLPYDSDSSSRASPSPDVKGPTRPASRSSIASTHVSDEPGPPLPSHPPLTVESHSAKPEPAPDKSYSKLSSPPCPPKVQQDIIVASPVLGFPHAPCAGSPDKKAQAMEPALPVSHAAQANSTDNLQPTSRSPTAAPQVAGDGARPLSRIQTSATSSRSGDDQTNASRPGFSSLTAPMHVPHATSMQRSPLPRSSNSEVLEKTHQFIRFDREELDGLGKLVQEINEELTDSTAPSTPRSSPLGLDRLAEAEKTPSWPLKIDAKMLDQLKEQLKQLKSEEPTESIAPPTPQSPLPTFDPEMVDQLERKVEQIANEFAGSTASSTPQSPLPEFDPELLDQPEKQINELEIPTEEPTGPTVPPVTSPENSSRIDDELLQQLRGIPPLSQATSLEDALRTVVMTRLLLDLQPREDRVNPVLLANQAGAQPQGETMVPATPEGLINDLYSEQRFATRMNSFRLSKKMLVQRFEDHQTLITEKAQRLREEYLALHERWVTHCKSLSEQAKPVVVEPEAATTVQPSGRTTRRSTANLGDAVRSDLEMEQIIASLGNDDATDPNHLSAKNLAVIPDMISVTNGRVNYAYDDTNHLVHYPMEYYGPVTGIHDWTESEKEIFLDRFAANPKQFGLIADDLPNKTAAQCVNYYYLHKKKFIDFRKVIVQYAPNKRRRRRTDNKKRGNGLLADIRQHDDEVHRDSDSPSLNGRSTRGRRVMPPPEVKKPGSRLSTVQLEETSTSTPTPEPDGRPRRRRAAAASASRIISASQEQEDNEDDEEEEPRPTKRAKRGRKVKPAPPVTDEARVPIMETRFVDQTDSITRKKPPVVAIQWSEQDKQLFLGLLAQHGDDFKRIAASMPNKTTIQVSNYYKSNLVELDLARVAACAPKRSPTPPQRGSWNDLPYPGSGIMSPITIPDPNPPTFGKNPSSSRSNRINGLPRIPALDTFPPPADAAWVNLNTRRSSNTQSRRPSLSPMHHEFLTSSSSRPLSPNQTRMHSSIYSRSANTSYPPDNPLPPPFASSQHQSYIYPPYSDPHYSLYDSPPLHSLPDPLTHPHTRPSTVPSIHKGENPYPVLSRSGATVPPTYFYS